MKASRFQVGLRLQRSNVPRSVPDSKDTSLSSCPSLSGHRGCRCQQGEAPVGRLHQTPVNTNQNETRSFQVAGAAGKTIKDGESKLDKKKLGGITEATVTRYFAVPTAHEM